MIFVIIDTLKENNLIFTVFRLKTEKVLPKPSVLHSVHVYYSLHWQKPAQTGRAKKNRGFTRGFCVKIRYSFTVRSFRNGQNDRART